MVEIIYKIENVVHGQKVNCSNESLSLKQVIDGVNGTLVISIDHKKIAG